VRRSQILLPPVVTVAVSPSIGVGVKVGEGVAVAVGVVVGVGDGVAVAVALAVGVAVRVAAGVRVGVVPGSLVATGVTGLVGAPVPSNSTSPVTTVVESGGGPPNAPVEGVELRVNSSGANVTVVVNSVDWLRPPPSGVVATSSASAVGSAGASTPSGTPAR
jgi:hypothetical protein